MGIATQRAVALGLLMNKLLNPSSFQSASEPPRYPRAGAHCALILFPTSELECVWWWVHSQCQEPACCKLSLSALLKSGSKCDTLSCSSALQKGGAHWQRQQHQHEPHLSIWHCDHGGSSPRTAWAQLQLRASMAPVVPWTKLLFFSCSWLREARREWSLGFSNPYLLLLAHAQQGVVKIRSCFSTWAGQLISLQEPTLTHLFASEGYSAD